MAKKKTDTFDYAGYNEVKNVVENLVNEWKRAGKITDGISRLSYDEAGVPLIEGIAVAVKDHTYDAVDAMGKAVSEINIKLKTGTVSTDEYYKYMEFYRDNFLEKGSLEWWKYTEKIVNYETTLNDRIKDELEKRKDAVVKTYSAILSEAGAEISSFKKLENSVMKGLDKYIDSFTGKTVTFKNAGEPVLKDGVWNVSKDLVYKVSDTKSLKDASDALGLYYDMLMQIKNKDGVPTEFFEMLRSMSVNDAISLSETLLTGSDEDFYEYIRNWEELNDTVKNVKNGLLSDEIDEILDKFGNIGENLKNDLSTALKELPDEFFKGGELSGEAFLNGFLSKLSRVAESIGEIKSEIYSSGVTYNNASYNFYSSGESVSAQLEAARNAETLNRLRG